MAVNNKLGIWNGLLTDNDFTVENGFISGYQAGELNYATKMNQALKNATVFPYVLSRVFCSTGNYTIDVKNLTTSNLDALIANVQDSINSYIAGVKVSKASQADSATTASSATSATNATNATNASNLKLGTTNYSNDSIFQVVTVSGASQLAAKRALESVEANYSKRIGTLNSHPSIGNLTHPVWVNSNGIIIPGSQYAGGTKVTLNGTTKSATEASFYAPTTPGLSGQFLVSQGSSLPPKWQTITLEKYEHIIYYFSDYTTNPQKRFSFRILTDSSDRILGDGNNINTQIDLLRAFLFNKGYNTFNTCLTVSSASNYEYYGVSAGSNNISGIVFHAKNAANDFNLLSGMVNPQYPDQILYESVHTI